MESLMTFKRPREQTVTIYYSVYILGPEEDSLLLAAVYSSSHQVYQNSTIMAVKVHFIVKNI